MTPGATQSKEPSTARPDCTLCAHFYVTWRAPFARGCRAFGFESATYPSLVVERETARPCALFEARTKGPPRAADGARGGGEPRGR